MIIVTNPSEIKKKHFDQIICLITKGGQVSKYGLNERLLNSEKIAYKFFGSKILSVAAIKNPNKSYKTRVFRLSKVNLIKEYNYELGYIVTDPDYEGKGYCQKVVSALLKKTKGLDMYATTRKSSMVHILKKHGFVKKGKVFKKGLTLMLSGLD